MGFTFALYFGIAIWTRAGNTGEFYVAGKGVHPIANGMATAADWMSAASFISMAGLARRSLERSNQPFGPQALRLAECRQRHGLPRYRLHNALSDALACAELFLVQLAQYDGSKSIKLKNFQ